MLAFCAGDRFCHLEDGLLIQVRYSCFASIGHEELRCNGSAKHLVLAPQLPLQNPESVKEDQLGFELRFRLVLLGYERVAGDEKVVGGFETVHVQSYDRPFCQQDRVQALGHEVFHGLQPAESAAVFLTEADITPNVVDRPSRFLTKDQPVRLPSLHGEIGLAPVAYGAKASPSGWG